MDTGEYELCVVWAGLLEGVSDSVEINHDDE
jgi:hypothetical protein